MEQTSKIYRIYIEKSKIDYILSIIDDEELKRSLDSQIKIQEEGRRNYLHLNKSKKGKIIYKRRKE